MTASHHCRAPSRTCGHAPENWSGRARVRSRDPGIGQRQQARGRRHFANRSQDTLPQTRRARARRSMSARVARYSPRSTPTASNQASPETVIGKRNWQIAAVDSNVRLGPSGRAIVDRSRHKLFPRAALAGYNRRLRRRNTIYELGDATHC